MYKRIVLTVTLAFLCMAVLLIIIVNQKDEKGLSRVSALQQAAVVLGYDRNSSYENFFDSENEEWFIPYLNFMYEKEYITEELTSPDSSLLEEISTQEIVNLLERCKGDFEEERQKKQIDDVIAYVQKEKEIQWEDWNYILDSIIRIYDKNSIIEEKELLIFATPAYVHELDAWNAVTDRGIFNFEGFAVDSYVDSKVKVTFCGEYVLRIEPVETGAVYENVIICEEENKLIVQLKGCEREFEIDGSIGSEEYVLADIKVCQGEIKKIKLKNEKISGKILTIKDGFIDIEGYGTLELHENVHVFKSYGEVSELSVDELIIGYNVYEFVVAENKICGIYMVREADAEKIRVIISSSDYESLYHNELVCSSDSGLKVVSGDETILVAAGEEFSVNKESAYFSGGKIEIEAMNDGDILFSDITRKSGNPSYPGKIELTLCEEGILMINEVYLEDYLKLVLPSEMPSGYPVEALKAQAVCARSYAYRQIRGNSYAELGAHVDDTTSFQVYNNTASNENTDRAVDETYGKILLYSGQPVTTYYYSTSWGYSTDVSVWGNNVSASPYLSGVKLSDAAACEVRDNSVFEFMIKSKNEADWESECPWYRWSIKWSAAELSDIINDRLSDYSLKNYDDVEVLQPDGSYVCQYIDSIGEVKNIDVMERATGGVVSRLLIEGSRATVILNKAGAVRNVLGSKESVYTKGNGEETSGHQYLPSAYFMIEEVLENDEVKEFVMTGGGFGHGIGMSQNGANELAKMGKTCEEILNIFYPGTEIKDVKEQQ